VLLVHRRKEEREREVYKIEKGSNNGEVKREERRRERERRER
jgi:hypothetical protein